MSFIKKSLSHHGLFKTLFELKGNPRACVLTEPLWGIPYSLYMPFATLFMYELGVNDAGIGFLLTVGMIFQVVASLFGGIAADKMGRRKTTIIFDIISWSFPPLIWMFAQNFWWFLIATILNSMWQITNNSWNCLLVEDCPPDLLVNVYTWVSVSGLLAVFFAPISSYFVGRFSVVPTLRVIYFITFVMMTTKFIVLYFMCTETEMGKIRMKQTKDLPVLSMLSEYRSIFFKIIKSPDTMVAFTVYVIVNITSMITSNFFALYVTKNLGVSETFIGIFPIANAIVMLLFIFSIQHKINMLKFRPVMLAGVSLFICSNVILLLAGANTLFMIAIYTISNAFAAALLMPRKDSILALFVDKQERARILGLIYVLMIGITAPFGTIVGILSSANRLYPFILNIILYMFCFGIILFSSSLKKHDTLNVQASN